MNSSKIVIHLSGPSCSGKSTLNQEIDKRIPGAYTVAYDKQKWQLAGYNRDKDKEIIASISLGLYEVVCQRGIPVQLDFFFRAEKDYVACKVIAEKYGYKFFSFALIAPDEVLLARFRERVASAKRMGTRISVTDETLFLENLKKPRFLPEGTPIFDTSRMDPAQIGQKIMDIVNS